MLPPTRSAKRETSMSLPRRCWRCAFPSSSELEHLARAIDPRRLITHAAARTLIGSTRYRVAKRTLANWVDGCEWRAGGDVELLRRPIGELAPILLARCHRQIRKRGGSFSPAV